jgi:hypothetical protein
VADRKDRNDINFEKKLLDLLENKRDIHSQIVEEREKIELLNNKEKRTFEEEIELVKKRLDLEIKINKSKEEELLKKRITVKEELNSNKITEKRTKELKDQLKIIDEQYYLAKEMAEQQELQNKSIDDVLSTTELWLKATLGISKELSFTQKLISAGGGKNSITGGLDLVVGKVKDVVSLSTVANSLFNKVVETTLYWGKEFEGVSAEIVGLTGQGRKMADMAWDASYGMQQMGVDLTKTSEAVKTLTSDLVGFNFLSKKQQTELVQTSGLLQSLGIAAGTSSRMISGMIKTLGYSTGETVALSKKIAATAIALGKQPGQVAEDFASVLPDLAGYGSRAVTVFTDLEAIASATSVSLQSLVGIAKQMDTFEGAATAAGKLNAVLGGGLINSIDLLTADAPQKIRMVMEAIESSGRNWENLDERFEQRAIAAAAGIQNLDEANRLFRGGLAGYDEAQKKMSELADINKTLNEAAADAQPIWDDLKRMASQFAVAAKPVVHVLKEITSFMVKSIDYLNEVTNGYGTTALLLGIFALKGFTLIRMFSSLKKVMGATGGVVGKLSSGVAEGAKSVGAAAKGVGEGIYGIAAGIGKSIVTVARGVGKGIAVIGRGIALAITFIGKAAMSAAPGLLALGGSLISIGAGIALAVIPFALLAAAIGYAAGEIGFMVNSLKDLFLSLNPAKVGIISLALVGLTAAVIAFAGGLNVLGMLTASPFFVLGLATFTIAMLGIKEVMDEIGGSKLTTFSVAMQGFDSVLKEIRGLEAEKVKLAIDLAAAGSEYHKAKAESVAGDSFTEAVKALTRTIAGAGGKSGGGTKIEIYLDGKMLESKYVTIKDFNNAVLGT